MYPQEVGFKVRETSKQAAKDYESKGAVIRKRVFEELHKACFGLAAEQLVPLVNATVHSVRSRLSELAADDLIEPTEYLFINYNGKKVIIWRIK